MPSAMKTAKMPRPPKTDKKIPKDWLPVRIGEPNPQAATPPVISSTAIPVLVDNVQAQFAVQVSNINTATTTLDPNLGPHWTLVKARWVAVGADTYLWLEVEFIAATSSTALDQITVTLTNPGPASTSHTFSVFPFAV